MNRWIPCKRRTFIQRARVLGFEGPYSGAKHQFLVYKNHRLAIPTNKEYSVPQLKMMLMEIEEIIGRNIKPEEWNDL